MTRKRAERLTGYQIIELPPEHGFVTVGAFEGGNLIVKALGRAEWIALNTLVDRVYMLHSRIVLQTHGYRCARCQSGRQLQIHHRKYRSHGGTHRIDNLEPVCWDCHRAIHRLERSK